MDRADSFLAALPPSGPSGGQLVVTLEKTRRFAPFDHDAREIGEALELLSRVTGSAVDCIAESKAAVEVRLGPWTWNAWLRPLNEPDNLRLEGGRVRRLTVIAGDGHNILEGRLGPGLPLPWLRGDRDVPASHARIPEEGSDQALAAAREIRR
ncbi:MAG: hypothetical protein HY613_07340 [Candidatus Rokubacteria bacterium]|nr:hypothetical protein [Candidatus Rokubacteria bacterium]